MFKETRTVPEQLLYLKIQDKSMSTMNGKLRGRSQGESGETTVNVVQ